MKKVIWLEIVRSQRMKRTSRKTKKNSSKVNQVMESQAVEVALAVDAEEEEEKEAVAVAVAVVILSRKKKRNQRIL